MNSMAISCVVTLTVACASQSNSQSIDDIAPRPAGSPLGNGIGGSGIPAADKSTVFSLIRINSYSLLRTH